MVFELQDFQPKTICLQPGVKLSRWGSAPLSLTLSSCPKQRSSSFLGSCSWVMEREMDRRFGSATAVLPVLLPSVVVKRELSQKANPPNLSIYVPTLTCAYELWVLTGRVRLRIQAAEMSSSIGWLSSALETEWGGQPLLFCVERSQWRGFGPLVKTPPVCLPWEVLSGMTNWEEIPRQTQKSLAGLHMSSGLGTPRDPPREAGECCWGEVRSGIPFLACCLHDPTLYERNGWMDEICLDIVKIRNRLIHNGGSWTL